MISILVDPAASGVDVVTSCDSSGGAAASVDVSASTRISAYAYVDAMLCYVYDMIMLCVVDVMLMPMSMLCYSMLMLVLMICYSLLMLCSRNDMLCYAMLMLCYVDVVLC
ncbi:hypothetical protein Lalb_Chr23g0268621 [Lupinus albus]|uniref:Uncharacterized protein n=1 Tax=Lupinus albus TaxID=3870 RepID=A0A6A4MUR2_LUPAL|nr:hypothetical protein Lalb_Chr23g0268621 [Lupinus albus]